MLFPNFMDYMMPKVLLFPDTIYHGWWMAVFFENGPITKQFIWDKGVNQLVTMASFDHFAQILLIQIVLIAVFLELHFYVFQKSDMAKRNNFYVFSMDGASVCMDLSILCFTVHCSDRVQDSVIHRRHSGSSDRNDHILYSRKA